MDKRIVITPILNEGETPSMFKSSTDVKRAMEIHLNRHSSYSLTKEMVFCFFDIPAIEAARIMRVSLSTLKKIRNWVEMKRWPCSMIHNKRFILTLPQIIKWRGNVISGLEGDFLDNPSGGIVIALNILREVREYARTYLHLVIPFRPELFLQNKKERKERERQKVELEMKLRVELEMKLRAEMKLRVEMEVEMEAVKTEPADYWPTTITQTFNFDYLFEVEDVLGLGPIKIEN